MLYFHHINVLFIQLSPLAIQAKLALYVEVHGGFKILWLALQN